MLKKTINKLAAVYKVFTEVHNADFLVAALPCNQVLSAVQEVVELSCAITGHGFIGDNLMHRRSSCRTRAERGQGDCTPPYISKQLTKRRVS